MKNRNNIPKEPLKNISFLSKIEQKNYFSVPENYFESLPEVINHKKLNNKYLIISFNKLLWKILLPTASLIVVVFIIFNFNNRSTKTTLTDKQLPSLTISEDYLEIDDDLIFDDYAKILEEQKDIHLSEDEDYINYLIDNDIDINLIIGEL